MINNCFQILRIQTITHTLADPTQFYKFLMTLHMKI